MMLTDFQLSLIAAGAAVVIGVWVFNLLQERRHRKAAERVFRGGQPDVLLGDAQAADAEPADAVQESVAPDAPDERLEPALGDLPDVEVVAVENVVEDAAPRLEPAVLEVDEVLAVSESVASVRQAQEPVPVSADGEPDESLHDPVVEIGVNLDFAQPQPAERLWQALHSLSGRVSKRLRLIVRGDRGWHEVAPHESGSYAEARALLQLADRQGALAESELALFVETLEQAVRDLGGHAAKPPLAEVHKHAVALDEFCASVDVQIAVHVVNRNGAGIAGSKLRGLLESAGFQWRPDGMFHLVDDHGRTLITLSNFDAAPFVLEEMRGMTTPGVTFWLDVPRVAAGPAVFDQLLAAARRLSVAVDGILVDDQRRLLADNVLTSIRGKIAEIQKRMAASELPAGGPRALRLFV